MSETSLQARLGLGADASPNKPKKAWKKYSGDHPAAAPWPPPESSSSPYQAEQGYNHGTPSLFERLGPKVTRPVQPRSLLERMELQENESTDTAHPSSETDFIPLDSVYSPNVSCGGDGEIAVDSSPSFSEGRVLTGIRPAKSATQTTASGNGFLPSNDRPDAYGARAADSERADTPPAPNKTTEQKAPGTIATDRAAHVLTSVADSGPSTHASSSRPALPLKARLGRALRSAVLENSKLRGPIDADKVERKIATIVTENVCEAFGAQMRKVKKEMDALHAGNQTEEAMARAKDQLLNGFGNKGAVGDEPRNTWSNRRDSHSRLASTSILPTPPPSEPLPAENVDKEKAPPTAPRAMFNTYHRSASLKGKERAVGPMEESDSAARMRRDSYTRPSLRASPMQIVHSSEGPLSGRSPLRTVSASPTQSSFAPHKRRFTGDELPRYRSPPLPRPPDRRESLRSPSRSPARTSYSDSHRSSYRSSPSRLPRSRSRPRREYSLARSFNSHRPSASRSPPPLSASYSNGFGPRSSRRSRSRSTASRGTFSNGRLPPEHEFNSRHAHEKRPFVRSPASSRGRSVSRRESRSPVPQRRKLTHPSPPRSRSPLSYRQRAPSYDPDPRLGHAPQYHANGNDAPYSTPRSRSPGRGYREPPSKFMFDPPPPSSYPHRSSAPPPPPNPCNNVPGLWFVKVGAGSPTVLEGRIVVEPEFAATWGLLPTRSAPTPLPNLSVVLLCLPTEAVSALYNSLAPTNPTPETLANAVAALETAWPQDGTLFLDMNDGAGGKTWLPHELDPASPLDVTNHIQPGPNVIRFIQLGSLVERTFILYASRREPPPDKPPDMDIVMVSQLFENAAVTTAHMDDPLFKFAPATTTVAAS